MKMASRKRGRRRSSTPRAVSKRVRATMETAVRGYVKYAREQADFEAQHGPVKVIWKDGKPFEKEQA